MESYSLVPSSFAREAEQKTHKWKLSPISAQVFRARYMVPRIVKEGWLYKRGEHLKTWRKRYLVLRDDGSLLGFRDKPEPGRNPDPTNTFTVKGCQVMCKEKPRRFIFVVRGLRQPREIERMFSVGSNEERAGWVEAFRFVDRYLRKDIVVIGCASSWTHSKPRESSPRDHPRKVALNDFELLRVLGVGSFGKVVLSRERSSDQLFAIKIVNKKKLNVERQVTHALTESRVLQRIKHPFLVGLKCSFQSEDRLCFVMDFVNGGELLFHLSREKFFSEKKARFYGAEILLALEYLHERGIIYRDLKLENLLLDRDGHLKITDFGLCKEGMAFGVTTKTFCGTPEYLAPEVLEDTGYGRAVDWWGLGAVMYEMMCGHAPFYSHDRNFLFDIILNDEIKFPPTLSPNASSLLGGLLSKNPDDRLGGGERGSKDIKEHAFFRCMRWKKLLAKELKPPFVPRFASDTDTRYFDPEFTEQSVELTLGSSPDSSWKKLEQPSFSEFSFQGDARFG